MLRSGWLTAQIAGSVEASSIPAFATLSAAGVLTLRPSADAEASQALLVASLENCTVAVPDASSVPHGFAIAVTAADGGAPSAAPATLVLLADSREDHAAWLSAIAVASVPRAWPGGTDIAGKPQPLVYEIWAAAHTPPGTLAAAVAGTGSSYSDAAAALPAIPLPFPALPQLDAVPPWARRGLYLQKLRVAAVTFGDIEALPDHRGGLAADMKRNTLLEVVAALEKPDPAIFGAAGDAAAARVADDTFTALLLNLSRPLPCPVAAAASAKGGSGGEGGEAAPYADPSWPHLCIAHQAVLLAVNGEVLDLSAKKRAFTAEVISGLVAGFASPDSREREFFKTLLHRLYTKLTQRRSAIRRALCTFFASFLAAEAGREGDGTPIAGTRVPVASGGGGSANIAAPPPPAAAATAFAAAAAAAVHHLGGHHPAQVHLPGGGGLTDVPPSTPAALAVASGVAEALEIVASIANGFSLPLKEEHVTMLTRYLLPLHKAASLEAFHPQLAYVCTLYASRDRTCAVAILRYLLRHWPRGNTAKQALLLAEVEDACEYIEPADTDAPLGASGSQTVGRALLALLTGCIGGTHFSLAERALLAFASQRVVDIVISHPACGATAFGVGPGPTRSSCLFAALLRNQAHHWHEGVKIMSGQLAAQLADVAPAEAMAVSEAVQLSLPPAMGQEGADS